MAVRYLPLGEAIHNSRRSRVNPMDTPLWA